MTIIVGLSWLTELVMIADSRVSWANPSRPPQDILRKLYTITDNNDSAVLGFSGNLKAASIIMKHLHERKFRNMRKKFIIERFKDDIRRWIEEIVLQEVPSELWGEASFILGGIEKRRHPKFTDGTMDYWSNLPEMHIYVYHISKSSGFVTVVRKFPYAIIGSGKALDNEIRPRIAQVASFGGSESRLHWARSMLLTKMIAQISEQKASSAIGGPFQIIRITNEKMEQFYIWHHEENQTNLQVSQDITSTTIRHPDLNVQCTIYPIWEL
jgi:hypothetical protein